MLDFRYTTFLTLCRLKSYTKTAQELHITQPAVTQHIRYLEEYFGHKLFEYSGKTLSLTPKGHQLYNFVITLMSDTKKIKSSMEIDDNKYTHISFGITLSIGVSLIEPAIVKVAKEHPDVCLNVIDENTSILLRFLEDGIIQFAMIEGHYDKTKYDSFVLRKERLIPVCSCKSHLCGKKVSIEEIFNERIVIREKGSGSRRILETWLEEHNYSTNVFKRLYEIGSINIIKHLLQENLGVSFMYRNVVEKELKEGSLVEFDIEDFDIKHEFDFVFLRGSIHKELYRTWFDYLKDSLK